MDLPRTSATGPLHRVLRELSRTRVAHIPALALAAMAVLATAAPSQSGRSPSGAIALHQAKRDIANDTLVLLVASHPDDRYLLPAMWLRYRFGARVAVLLASRGGGGQNSRGPESGDELERIRTIEAEAGCATFDGEVWHLNRPDFGFRRSAEEAFAEWGREDTIRELARLLRTIRPDVVISTHHAEETHGHDLALAQALPLAVAMAADGTAKLAQPPHELRALFLGATSEPVPAAFAIDAEELEPIRGDTYRRLAYDALQQHHVSPGLPAPIDAVFEPTMRFHALSIGAQPAAKGPFDGVPTMFDGIAATAAQSAHPAQSAIEAAQRAQDDDVFAAIAVVRALESIPCAPDSDAARRRDRRLEAARRLVLQSNRIQIEVSARPGAAAVPGEELSLDVIVRVGGSLPAHRVRASTARGALRLDAPDAGDGDPSIEAGSNMRAVAIYPVPLDEHADADATDARFRRDRYTPPVQLRISMQVEGVDVSHVIAVPVELQPPVRLTVVPRMLMLPASRGEVRFAVKAERNSAYPVLGELDLRAPAGYRIEGPRTKVALESSRSDVFEFSLRAPQDRSSGVDRIRISLGANRVVLPVHKVEAQIARNLRIGVVRSLDDALTSVIGAGGFGLAWSGLSDTDLAVGDLDAFDTIVIDVRALRDRPQARQSFRRLLEFASRSNKRLVVLYHKDAEYDPPGEGFRGAPFQPFHIGKDRVTRADAPIAVLAPSHPLLNAPNRIESEDWDGWEQERGLYFPAVYASEYEEILECNDPGLPPLRSALLYARTGDGEFVYCALSLWRQLKKLHPGSVRMLANLLTPSPRSAK